MSKHYSSSGGSDRRRESSSRSRREESSHRSRHRSSSPGPSRRDRSPKPRDEKVLPKTFGRREETDREREVDDLNVLQRMKTTFENSPLQALYSYMKTEQKVKIWTRNYKEVRGVMTGYIIAFDKHWNLIFRDVDEVYLKHKKSKTPFLREVAASENLPDIPAKVPRQKKTEEEKAAAAAARAAAAATPQASEGEGEVKVKKEKTNKRRKKKNKNTSEKRHIKKLFIRGDNVVMVTPVENEREEEAQEEETQEEQEAEEGEHVSENA